MYDSPPVSFLSFFPRLEVAAFVRLACCCGHGLHRVGSQLVSAHSLRTTTLTSHSNRRGRGESEHAHEAVAVQRHDELHVAIPVRVRDGDCAHSAASLRVCARRVVCARTY